MTKHVVTVKHDTSLDAAAKAMMEKNITKLPVIKKGKVLGVLHDSDYMKLHVKNTIPEIILDIINTENDVS
jgi:predicted transcriptional regulator